MVTKLEPLPIAHAEVAPAKPLVENHFAGDQTRRITEAHLREVLAAPVFIEKSARVGVVPVTGPYAPDDDLPLVGVPGVLSDKLDDTKAFDVVTEVSTDWPTDRGLPGLRELAARYRAEYLLLYRHRFVDDRHTNGWGFAYATLIGALFVPSRTLEAAGVLEATLFDVKSGTIMFTVFERVRGERTSNVWQTDRKIGDLKQQLLAQAAARLGDKVTDKVYELTRDEQRLAIMTKP